MWSVQPKMFGWFHIMGIVVALAFGYAGVLLGRRFKASKNNGRQAKAVLWGIELCFVVLEFAKEAYYAISGGAYRWDLFPMQICSVIFIVLPIALICRDGIVKDSVLGFVGFCSLASAVFYLCKPAAAMNATYIIFSLHSFFWHWLMILTGTFVIVSFELPKKKPVRMLVGSYTVWFVFAILSAVIDNIAHITVPELHIDYYHIGYEKVVYPLMNLIFDYPEPYIPFFLTFLVYFALGTVAIYYATKGICRLNGRIFRKKREEAQR